MTKADNYKPQKDRKLVTKWDKYGSVEVAAYDPEIMLRVCDGIIDGKTIKDICSQPGIVSYGTILRWIVAYPEAARSFQAARELSSYTLDDEALAMVREIRDEPGSPQRVRAFDVAVNHMRWVAARRNPRVYSERAAMKITVPIQINTSLDLDADRQGEVGKDGQSVYTIKAENTIELPPKDVTAEEAMVGDPGTKPLTTTRRRMKK